MKTSDCDIGAKGIEVVAEVTFSGKETRNEIKVTFAPNVETLLPQVETLFRRIRAHARGTMLKTIADKFLEIGVSGVSPEYKHEPLCAHVIISMPGGSVAIINGVEVNCIAKDIAESAIFESEQVEQAKERLILQLLADFAALGGQ